MLNIYDKYNISFLYNYTYLVIFLELNELEYDGS